ncbi:alpha/beta hydrolase [Mucilaginibacter ginkgonis]|uniref:Alpha/beta hydrolase n=1 Tax=Mucilaginibacter ginkgonis TaxID=2682091 RepID=A0A6I4I1P7_9SPHI|nr:alpha/beta hydrolase-fold protein [Mucilaginibacter ginkgonis]QQL48262.1 alpha/beta hydrolase [Mucilaginibacter ginkgonis]
MKFVLHPLSKLFFIYAIVLSALSVSAQTVKNNKIVMGVIDSVNSKILKETRKIWVYVPASAAESIYAPKKYPVIYLLDGDAHFASVAGMVQQLSGTVCPEMIVVAIPNTDRLRDLTPNHIGPLKNSGGGKDFISFIELELMPYINLNYPAASYKMLIGHSLGGLLVINTLAGQPGLFNSYVAIDPSMWFDRGIALSYARKSFAKENLTSKSLYMGIANTLPEDMDTTLARKDTSAATGHIRAILNLKDIFQKEAINNKLKFAYHYYANDSHGSIPFITEYDALRFIFRDYAIPQSLTKTFFDKNIPSGPIIAKVEAHYNEISKNMGYKFSPPEDVMNDFGLNLISANPKLAYTFLQYNINAYPNSYNVYDSMGDYYNAVHDKSKAIELYQKALSLKEFSDTRTKLNKLINK